MGIVTKLGVAMMGLMFVVLVPLGFVMDQIFSNFYFSHVREGIAQQADKYAKSFTGVTNLNDYYMLNMFEKLAEYTNTYILIVNQDGVVLANSGIEKFPKLTTLNKTDWLKFAEGRNVSTEDVDLQSNFHYLVEGRPIKSSDEIIGGLFILSSVSNIHHFIYQIRSWLVLTIFISILLAIGFIYLLSNKLSVPLLQMVSATRKIARGNLETRVTINTRDEIGLLATSINELAVELKEYRSNRSEFFANISHELRTPITYLEGYAHLLKNRRFKTEEEEKNCIEIIEQEAKRMSTLVNDLFELSKMEEGRFPLQFEWLDVQEVLESAVSKNKIKAMDKLLELELLVDGEIPLIRADGVRLEQIFINLIENAIRYTEKGSITIQLKYQSDQVIIIFKDTGPGIPEGDIPYIFERFYRVEKSRSRNLGGTGLGLAIVKNLVELQQGSINVKSTLGIGTTFEVYFPTNKHLL